MNKHQEETKKRYINILPKIKATVSAADFKAIKGFSEAGNFLHPEQDASPIRKYRRVVVLHNLLKDCRGKQLSKLSEKDIQGHLKSITNDYTKQTSAKIIKCFYRWLDANKYAALINSKVLKVQDPYTKPGNVISSNDLLSQEECLALIQAANSKRDAGLYAVLIGSGARIGEAMNLCRKDVNFTADGSVILSLRGKTGLRETKVHNGLSRYVKEWAAYYR